MLDKPNLSEARVVAALEASYAPARKIEGLEFLPVGNDATAWSYQVDAGGETHFFLKIKSIPPLKASVLAPHLLNRSGLAQVIAPLPTVEGAFWTTAERFSLLLYPYIDGISAMEQGLTPAQWVEFGRVLKRVHRANIGAEQLVDCARESFVSKYQLVAHKVERIIASGFYNDRCQRELAQFWRGRRDEIDHILKRAAELGAICRQKKPELVVCHADIHTANLLVTDDETFFIVDWDETLFAPVERDLMFIGGEVAKERMRHGKVVGATEGAAGAADLFYRGYGSVQIDPEILAYYRYDWVVQEIGDYAQRVFLMDDLGEETKRDAVDGFKELFDPGDVVEAARRAGEALA